VVVKSALEELGTSSFIRVVLKIVPWFLFLGQLYFLFLWVVRWGMVVPSDTLLDCVQVAGPCSRPPVGLREGLEDRGSVPRCLTSKQVVGTLLFLAVSCLC
jgi:hypothetical protein